MRDPDLRDAYEERAGILEYDAGMPRHRAESAALIMTRNWAQSLTGRRCDAQSRHAHGDR
jgi:hypothetical protein